MTTIPCPVCGARITVDEKFVTRECGHGVMETPAGVLIATPNLAATRTRLSRWAYEPAIVAAQLSAARRELASRAAAYVSPATWPADIEHSQ